MYNAHIGHSNSMPHEFYQIMVGAPTINLHSWKQLARWSIEYSCLSGDEKAEGQQYLEKSWEEFCATVVKRYGKLMLADKKTIDKLAAEREYEKMLKTNTGKPIRVKSSKEKAATGAPATGEPTVKA